MIGSRIKLARKRAGMSLRDLADALNGLVSAQAIGKYERDEMTPSSKVLIAMSKTLGVSVPYLLDTQGIVLSHVDFRTKASTTAKDRAVVETNVLEWVERYLQIETILELDSSDWKSPLPEKYTIHSVQEAEDLADKVRELWDLGTDPIPNVTELLEENGLKVLVIDLPDKVSGLTCLVNRPDTSAVPVIVVNRQFSLERRRLTLAHELAHRLIDDSKLSDREEEQAATRFASAFLMPKAHLLQEVGQQRHSFSYRELMDLKRIYRVSAAALLVRLRDIGVISESVLTYAFQSIARKWRTEEPEPIEAINNTGVFEQAKRFERLCYRALAEGLISPAKAAELLQVPLMQVEIELKGPVSSNADYCQ